MQNSQEVINQDSFVALIEKASKVNEQFASSLQTFQDKAIQKELKNIPQAVK